MTLLMDKYDSLDTRMGFCEANVMERYRDTNNKSAGSSHQTRSTSQLRMHQKQSAMAGGLAPHADVIDRLNQFQIQIDRLDCKTAELREAQMRQSIDPKPLIRDAIDNLM